MGKIFNETFFKFLLGFIAIVMISLIIMVIATGYLTEDELTTGVACPPGEVC